MVRREIKKPVPKNTSGCAHAEEALGKITKKFHSLVELVPHAIYECDSQGVITIANSAYSKITGYTQDELIGKYLWELMAPGKQKESLPAYIKQLVSEQPAPTPYITRNITKDGQIIDVQIDWSYKRNEKGQVTGFACILSDITERKKAERVVEEIQTRLSDFFENTPMGFHIFGPDQIITDINETELKLIGYCREEVVGKKTWAEFITPEQKPLFKKHWQAVLTTGRVDGLEYTLIHKDGRKIDVILNASSRFDDDGSLINTRGSVLDITEKKQAEKVLKRHELRLQSLLDINKMTEASEQEILDFAREEAIKVTRSEFSFIGFVNEDESAMTINAWSKEAMAQCSVIDKPIHFPIAEAGIWAEPVRQRKPFIVNDYSADLPHKRGCPKGHVPIKRFLSVPVFEGEHIVAAAAVANKEENYDELDIRALTSIMSDTWQLIRRKQAEESLRESEERFRTVIERASEALFLIELNGKFVDVNQRACDELGYTREELLNLSVPQIASIFNEKTFAKFVQTLRMGVPVTLEAVHQRKDGTTLPVEVRTGLMEIHGKLHLLSLVRNITKRKDRESHRLLAEKILKSLNQKNNKLDTIQSILTLIKESTGFEAVGVRLRQGDDFPYFAVKGFSAEFVEVENYLCCRDGKGELVLDSKGGSHLVCMCGNVLSGRTDPALPFFTEGGSFWTNSTTELLASVSPEEMKGQTRNQCCRFGYESVALIPLRSGDEILGLLQLNDTRRGRFTPGMIRFFEGTCASIGITIARIKAEEQVRNLAKFPSENPNPVLRAAKDGTILYSNKAGYKLLNKWKSRVGKSASQDWCDLITGVLNSHKSKAKEVKLKGRIYSFAIAPVPQEGYVNIYGRDVTKEKKAEEAIKKARDELEKQVAKRTIELSHTIGTLQEEIRERMIAERTLNERSKTLEAFFSNSITPLVFLDPQFNFIRVNQAYADACQRDVSEFPGRNHFELYPSDAKEIFEEVVHTKIAHQVIARAFTFPDHPEWGVTYWNWTLTPIMDDTDEVELLVFALEDVTERKRAELKVQRSEEKYRELVENANSIIMRRDTNGNITFFNEFAQKFFGYSEDEILGKNVIGTIAPETEASGRDLRALIKKISQNPEEYAANENENMLKDGERVWISWTNKPIRDETGKVVEILAVGNDITQFKQAQEKILADQKRLRSLTAELVIAEERERRKIARNMHDSIGQILAFSARELGTLHKSAPEKLTGSLAEIKYHLDDALKQTRTLTFNLSPPILYDLGFEAAVDELVEQFSRERKIECRFESHGEPGKLADHTKILLYRSVRELLMNIAKHANAKLVRISLSRINNDIQVAVEDDGIGFDLSRLGSKSISESGFGLFSIRERLTHIGGKFDIQTSSGKGTKVTLLAPVKPRKLRAKKEVIL